MDHFAGLDVSVKETSVCIVDDTGRIAREVKVASEPDTYPAHPVQRRSVHSRARQTTSPLFWLIGWPGQFCTAVGEQQLA